MRGLDARIYYAKLKVLAIHDPKASEAEMYEVHLLAEQEGYSDYYAGLDLPIMFADEPVLKRSWIGGWRFAEQNDITSNCGECQNSSGNPCSSHG